MTALSFPFSPLYLPPIPVKTCGGMFCSLHIGASCALLTGIAASLVPIQLVPKAAKTLVVMPLPYLKSCGDFSSLGSSPDSSTFFVSLSLYLHFLSLLTLAPQALAIPDHILTPPRTKLSSAPCHDSMSLCPSLSSNPPGCILEDSTIPFPLRSSYLPYINNFKKLFINKTVI